VTLWANKAAGSSVSLHGVTKKFGDVTAVNDITLELPARKLITFLGPSGCGKTTTLRLIAGLETASAGRIMIGDTDVTHVPANRRPITMVFQSYALFPHLNVFENVAYGLKNLRVPRPDIERAVGDTLALMGLAGLEQRASSQLSGGQQQRVALARALVMRPEVLLLDEPLSNLDAKLRKQLRQEIRSLQQRLEITAVYVTHDQSEALALSDVIVVMRDGVIEQVGTPEQLYNEPATAFVAQFIGDANLVDATVENGGVFVQGYKVPYSRPVSETGRRVLVIRPEAITIRPADRLSEGGGLPGRVLYSFYQGMSAEYMVETDAGRLMVVDSNLDGPVLPPGQPVELEFSARGMHLLPAAETSPRVA